MKNVKSLLLGSLLTLASVGSALAATAQYSWSPPANTAGITGYQIMWGTASGNYTSKSYVAGVTTATATTTNLNPGTYYGAVRSCGNSTCSVYSVNSNEVTFNVPLDAPTSLTITITVTAGANTSLQVQ